MYCLGFTLSLNPKPSPTNRETLHPTNTTSRQTALGVGNKVKTEDPTACQKMLKQRDEWGLEGLGFGEPGLGFWVLGFSVEGLRFKGSRVWGLGLRIEFKEVSRNRT